MNQTKPDARYVTHRRPSASGCEMNPTSARHLLADLARLEMNDMRRHHVELVAATADLARAARLDWPWTHDDPTVAVLRALSKIALLAPEATSPRATALRQQLANPHTAVPSKTGDIPGRAR